MLISYSSTVVFELYFIVEGRCKKELPEKVFANCRIAFPDINMARTIHPNPISGKKCMCKDSQVTTTTELLEDDILEELYEICETQ